MTTQTKPVIELRRISQNERMSDETHCYSAVLYVDGEKWGEVANRGCGGADEFHGICGPGGKTYADLAALDLRIKATYPPISLEDVGMPGETMGNSLESICAELVCQHVFEKEMNRALRTKIMFFKVKPAETGPAGDLYEIALKNRPVEALAKAITTRDPGAVVLNTLPTAEALALYRRAG